MIGGQSEALVDNTTSIYERFKENTHKIMIGENSAINQDNKAINVS